MLRGKTVMDVMSRSIGQLSELDVSGSIQHSMIDD